MSALPILRLGTVKVVERFQAHVASLGVNIPCDSKLLAGESSPLRLALNRGGVRIGNRIAVQPMEGWDGGTDGNPSEHTKERWRKFGGSGAKLIWGGEAIAVSHEGRANPNQTMIADFHRTAKLAEDLGFDFVDIKHCHGYLGHEFLSAHTREGKYGGSFENRTRFLREVVAGVRANAPRLEIGVRLSAFDTVAYRPDPSKSVNGKPGPGIPEVHDHLIPYRWGFGVDANRPTEIDLTETIQFLSLLEELNIPLVNLTAGSPYYNPHIQRPALYPPSDGYQPAEDPLINVARQMGVARELKRRFPNLLFVGTAYSYLQDFLPNVAQAAVREGWIDAVGLGRMILTYPEILHDASEGKPIEYKRVCRTLSDCTTAPRKGLPSGCYPLDSYYKHSEFAEKLKLAKAKT